jgi:YYY domain-containing protein
MNSEKHPWLYDLLLILVLVVGAYFRTVGLNWDAEQHLHPDERFLTMVESALQVKECALPKIQLEACPPEQIHWLSLADYLDTQASPLNPVNRGYGFFVYGDFPIVVVRYVAEWLGQTGYDQVHLVGRQLSALSDLLTILVLYIIGSRLYNRRVALLGAAFSSLAVEQIQQSHFFIVDNFANLFIFLAVFFAVEIAIRPKKAEQPLEEVLASETSEAPRPPSRRRLPALLQFIRDPLFLLSLGFGVSLGLAVASKLNAAPLAIVLPGAFFMRYLITDRSSLSAEQQTDYWTRVLFYLGAGAALSLLAFRIAQPYAFQGLGLSSTWLQNIRDLQAQSSGDADVPFALQWARRSHLFSFKNLIEWGLGLPLGILAWIGFLVMAWRIFKGDLRHALLWGWTALYFGWQSIVFNPTMRYQLPIYPLLCLMAGWLLVYLWDEAKSRSHRSLAITLRTAAIVLGVVVLVLTAAWAYAFTRIYTRPVTRLAATYWIYQNIPSAMNLRIEIGDNAFYQQPVAFPTGGRINSEAPYILSFAANATGALREVYLPHVAAEPGAAKQTITVTIGLPSDSAFAEPLATGSVVSDFPTGSNPRGGAYTITLDRPVNVLQGQAYMVRLEASEGVELSGAAPINESDWDDGLPLRLGLEGYDGFGGLYQGGLNLQIYYDDDQEKLARFVTTLSQGDAIFMSSNRQWATVTRVPERYPLTTEYYRDLIGCPDGKDVIWCYNVARPGMFDGKLGYKLVAVFESFPTINIPGVLHWEVNDQFAEEAFTVYDHPKVLIFEKQPGFSAEKVQSILGAVDLSHVVHLTPRQAGAYKSLMLSAAAEARQQAGGTWSQLFSYEALQNRFPVLGLVIWYLFIFLLGLLVYPIIRLALPGLGDRGYPVSRVLGLVLLAYFSWLAGSAGISMTRLTVAAVLLLVAGAGIGLGWWKRRELAEEWRTRRSYFLMVEGLFLAFFLFDLLIRIGNPDLWHPARGGERPMDFSYFNAIIKSTIFPPYDPWFSGGYINYYYYGFVLMAMPVKLLGIVPTLAYNFILPTLFASVAMGAFCVGWNLLDGERHRVVDAAEAEVPALESEPLPAAEAEALVLDGQAPPPPESALQSERPAWLASLFDYRFLAGFLAALLMVVLGNLGTVRMVYQGLERLGAPNGDIEFGSIPQRFIWAVQGVANLGQGLPYNRGDWYWNPSRVIPPGPGNEITEFPFFTFLYSDLHAHMLAMPIGLLGLAWALSILKARRVSLFSLIIGALVIGALYPTNLSDIYTYLPLGFAVLAYSIWRSDMADAWRIDLPAWLKKLALIFGSTALFVGLSYLLYEPYRLAYSQGYGALDTWTASNTPIWSYLTHWGVFLFILTGWLAWETREWMASTPVSSLNKLRPYQVLIEAGIAFFLVTLLYLALRGVQLGWVALPLAVWSGILLLRPGLSDVKRFVLFLTGTALLITVVVEIIVVRGDIGRMNTIFKFWLQGWALLSVSSAAALVWLLPELRKWLPRWRNFYQAGAVMLLAGAALYTVSATTDKLMDRMSPLTPWTLDSITYMRYSQYPDFGVTMDLSHDYQAIRWMQDNIKGSPVIVEANCPEYRWCTRFTIYTGLPGVVGWNWHQRQQRTLSPEIVEQRIGEVDDFYATPDVDTARAFLAKYNVRYIVLGELERAEYQGPGLDKFAKNEDVLWKAVYREGDTVIYQVLP